MRDIDNAIKKVVADLYAANKGREKLEVKAGVVQRRWNEQKAIIEKLEERKRTVEKAKKKGYSQIDLNNLQRYDID